MQSENRRDALKLLACGAAGAAGAFALNGNLALATEQKENPSFIKADGSAVRTAVRASSIAGIEPIRFEFTPGGGAGWHRVPVDLNPPANAAFATITLSGWELRVNKSNLSDINWHDGGAAVGFESIKRAICSVLLRDDTGDEPFNGFVNAIVAYYT